MNGARVVIERNLIAELLGYHKGKVHRIAEPENHFNPSTIHLYIEHPDLPNIEEGKECQDIVPMVEVKYYKNGRYSYKRLT